MWIWRRTFFVALTGTELGRSTTSAPAPQRSGPTREIADTASEEDRRTDRWLPTSYRVQDSRMLLSVVDYRYGPAAPARSGLPRSAQID